MCKHKYEFLLNMRICSLLFAPRQQNVVFLLSCSSWDVLATPRSSLSTLPHRLATLIYALLHFPQPFTFPAPNSLARERTVLPTSSDVCVHGVVETRLSQLS